MGSGFAGAKAGILGGIFFAAAIGGFNALLLYVSKGEVLQLLSNLPDCASQVAGQNGSADYCFSTLVSIWIPFYVFVIFAVSLFFACSFGMFFEYVPGRGYKTKSAVVSFIMLIMLIFFGFEGLSASATERFILVGFDTVAALAYAVILARLYRRYTREVVFQSEDQERLKIMVDRRDLTGRVRTFSLHSSHTIRAPSGSGTFKEWLVSGGVSVEDARSFETTMKVEGDGMLKIS